MAICTNPRYRVLVDGDCPATLPVTKYFDGWNVLNTNQTGDQLGILFLPSYGSGPKNVSGTRATILSVEVIYFHSSPPETSATTGIYIPHPQVNRVIVFLDREAVSSHSVTNLSELLTWDSGGYYPFIGLPNVETQSRFEILYDAFTALSGYGENGGLLANRPFIEFPEGLPYTFRYAGGSPFPTSNNLYIGVLGSAPVTYRGSVYYMSRVRFVDN